MPSSSRDTLGSRFVHVNTMATCPVPDVGATPYYATDGQGGRSTVAGGVLYTARGLILTSIEVLTISSTTVWSIRTLAGAVILTGSFLPGTGARRGWPKVDVEIDQPAYFQIDSGNADILFGFVVR